MITIDGARAYFTNHVRHGEWEAFGLDQRKAAIEQAKRDLSRALGRAMNEDEASYMFGDRTRDEFAVYEQALYTLIRDAPEMGEAGNPVPSLSPDESTPARHALSSGAAKWSREALAWLGAKQLVELVHS